MASINVRKNEKPSGNLPARMNEPGMFRRMNELFSWDPFRSMEPLFPLAMPDVFSPDFEIKETANQYLFKADVPGMKEGDLDITLTGNRLTISGNRSEEKEEQGETYYSCERKYGSFSRAYTLPEGADFDHIRTDLSAGVLTIAVPKKAEVQAKKIAIGGGGGKA
jgi:HSP20 family protein